MSLVQDERRVLSAASQVRRGSSAVEPSCAAGAEEDGRKGIDPSPQTLNGQRGSNRAVSKDKGRSKQVESAGRKWLKCRYAAMLLKGGYDHGDRKCGAMMLVPRELKGLASACLSPRSLALKR